MVIGYTTILNVKGGRVIGFVAHAEISPEFLSERSSLHFNRHHFAGKVCRTRGCYVLTYREYLQRRRKNTALKLSAIRVEKKKNFDKTNLIWNSTDTIGRTGNHGNESRGREQEKAGWSQSLKRKKPQHKADHKYNFIHFIQSSENNTHSIIRHAVVENFDFPSVYVEFRTIRKNTINVEFQPDRTLIKFENLYLSRDIRK